MSRVAGQLAIPAVLGLVIGVVLAFQSGTSNAGLTQIPLGTYVTPTASNTAAALVTTAPAAGMKSNTTCDIIVPANPLSAQGLATPYQLTGPNGMTPAQSGCEMSNGAKLGAFVQATILDPATGALSVYEPLVITQGTWPDTPGRKLKPPAIPADAVVTIGFGFNGTDLVLVGATPATLADAHCVSGQAGSAFGQTSFCNGASFFDAVRQAERKGLLKVPSPGTSNAIVPSGGDLGTGLGRYPLGDFVDVAGGWQPGPDVEELADALLGRQVSDRTAEERPVLPGRGAPGGHGSPGFLGHFAVGGEVVLAAEGVVVNPGRVRARRVGPWRLRLSRCAHQSFSRERSRRAVSSGAPRARSRDRPGGRRSPAMRGEASCPRTRLPVPAGRAGRGVPAGRASPPARSGPRR